MGETRINGMTLGDIEAGLRRAVISLPVRETIHALIAQVREQESNYETLADVSRGIIKRLEQRVKALEVAARGMMTAWVQPGSRSMHTLKQDMDAAYKKLGKAVRSCLS